MKKIIKHIGLFILAILGLFMGVVVLIIFSGLSSENKESIGNNSESIILEYERKGRIPTFEEQEPIFKDTMEEALIAVENYYFKDYPYMSKVDNIIKTFENDEYAALFYQSVKNSKTDGFVASKFKIRVFDGKKQYAVILVLPVESGGKQVSNELDAIRDMAVFFDYFGEFGISNESRFIFGSIQSDKVKTLKIEGQMPTEVIEYFSSGKKEYFWYYENLISDKPSTELHIEVGE
ncbi:hypothetical protein [Lacrimispora sp.]|uniref:hypothetical protein n=1 Tax=Lacrimispora sp. TaxID=2719234 RepID=UPI003993D797